MVRETRSTVAAPPHHASSRPGRQGSPAAGAVPTAAGRLPDGRSTARFPPLDSTKRDRPSPGGPRNHSRDAINGITSSRRVSLPDRQRAFGNVIGTWGLRRLRHRMACAQRQHQHCPQHDGPHRLTDALPPAAMVITPGPCRPYWRGLRSRVPHAAMTTLQHAAILANPPAHHRPHNPKEMGGHPGGERLRPDDGPASAMFHPYWPSRDAHGKLSALSFV